MSTVKKVLHGYKPLVYVKDGLLLSRGFNLYLSNLNLDNIQYISSVPVAAWKNLAVTCRLLSRLMRLGIGPARAIANSQNVFICLSRLIFLLNLENGQVIYDFQLKRGSRPLMLTEINIDGFTPGLYFGEYLHNPDKDAVHIYRRDNQGLWSIAHTFNQGEINHIHALIPDLERNCVYILTGDFDSGAAIWRAEDNFRNVQPYSNTGQTSRACWLRPYKGRLYYAMDTQLEVNYFNSVLANHELNGQITQHFPIMGSSIYHVESPYEKLTFSTAVEPGQGKGKYINLFSILRGPGILSDHACVYSGNIDNGFSLVLKAQKDSLPFGLFQFGSFQFPAGFCPDPTIVHAYGVAVKGYDDTTILIDVSDTCHHYD